MNKQVVIKVSAVATATVISLILFESIGLFLVIGGIMLTLTIIGAILGIPMILFGLAFMILAPFGGLGMLTMKRKECPNCHSMVTYSSGQAAVTCRICLKRLKISDKGETLTVVS